MIAWVALTAVVYAAFFSGPAPEKGKVNWFFAVLTFGYIIFWAGVRTGVADTAEYIYAFENYPDFDVLPQYFASHPKGPGFSALGIFFRSYVSANYHLWLMFIAIVSGISVMTVVRQHSVSFFLSAYFFIVSLNFMWLFNGIRQFLPAAILFGMSWLLIVDNKRWIYALLIVLLSYVHLTVIILLPFCFLTHTKPFGPRMMLISVGIILIIIFMNPVFSTMDDILSETSTGYTMDFSAFEDDDGVHPLRVLVAFTPSIIALARRKVLIEYGTPFIHHCVLMSFVAGCLYLVGMFSSGIMIGRLPIYFELYNIILLPFLLKCFSRPMSYTMTAICVLMYFAFYYLQMQNSYYISEITGLIENTP